MVSEEELKEIIEKHNYKLLRVVRFKHRDRIIYRKPNGIKVTLYLNGKIEDFSHEDMYIMLFGLKRGYKWL